MKRAFFLLALFLPAISSATCTESASMVESFGMLRDKGVPLSKVGEIIDALPPPGGLAGSEVGEYVAILHNLAAAVYQSPSESPADLAASFKIYCTGASRSLKRTQTRPENYR